MPDYSKNFLASMTGFMNMADEPDNVNTGDPAKSNRIPLPDYKNPQSRLSYATSFKKKYAPESLPGFGEIPLRVNEKPVYGSDTSKNLANKAAIEAGLDPALFYASSMIEGQSGLYSGAAKDEKGNPAYRGYTGDKNFPVSGLWGFGLDSFQDYYPTLKKKGYLPDDFDKEFTIWDKEGGPMGANADPEGVMFRNTDAGIKAKAAMMRAFYDETDAYAKKKGIDLTPNQRDFFGLAHFNSGDHGYELLDAYKKAGLLEDGKLPAKMPNIYIPFRYKGKPMSKEEAEKLHKQIYNNIAPRLAAARGLKEEGLFD